MIRLWYGGTDPAREIISPSEMFLTTFTQKKVTNNSTGVYNRIALCPDQLCGGLLHFHWQPPPHFSDWHTRALDQGKVDTFDQLATLN